MRKGLAKKYEFLIHKLTCDSIGEVVLFTTDYIHIRTTGSNKGMNFFISETLNTIEIVWVRQLSVHKTLKHTWTFLQNYPQDKMIHEISACLRKTTNQLSVPNFHKKFRKARRQDII